MGKVSTAGVLRLRATSAVSCDKSVRRSAQDDDFVGILTKNVLDKLALMGQRSMTHSVEMTSLLHEKELSSRPERSVVERSALAVEGNVLYLPALPEDSPGRSVGMIAYSCPMCVEEAKRD